MDRFSAAARAPSPCSAQARHASGCEASWYSLSRCGGGRGPWQADWLDALKRWVERGHAPDEITLGHPGNGHTRAVRPVPHR
ncbi:MAG: hypothetical protein ING49_16675 [Rubrivivax sp.]|jgi:hypothetical protein|nr:hypothetical protein [Rubrivivax sp.]MCA3260107.1 hypothetical protein [Rubrivivax sp.]